MKAHFTAFTRVIAIVLIICLYHPAYASEGEKILGGVGNMVWDFLVNLFWIVVGGFTVIFLGIQFYKQFKEQDEEQ
jgi:uncharacterized membrane protein